MPLNYELADFSQHDPRYLEYGHDWITPKPTLGETKAAELAKAVEEKRRALISQSNKQNENAWAEGTGTAGDLLKQGAAAVYSGAARIGGDAVKAIGGAIPEFNKGTLESHVMQAYEVEKNTQAELQKLGQQMKAATDPKERAALWSQRLVLENENKKARTYLDSPMDSSKAPGIMANIHDITDPGITRRDVLTGYLKSAEAFKPTIEYGDKVIEAGQSAVNRKYTEGVTKIAKESGAEAGAAWSRGDYGTAIGTALLAVGEAIVTNPAGAYTLGLESLLQTLSAANPYTAVATYGPLLANAITKGKEDYAKEHDGLLPGEAQTGIIEIASVLAVGSDLVGDRLMLKLTPILRDAIKKNPTSIPPTLREQLVAKHPKFKEVFKEAGVLTGMVAFESGQGGFQNTMEQFAGKQDWSKVDPSEVAEAGIIEGTAAGLMGGARALATPGKVLGAGSTNKVTDQAVTAIEAFQKTPEGQSIATTKEPAGAAYTAFQKVSEDTTITPEAKQAAFDNALAAIVSNPNHPNIKVIAGRLKETATKAGITLPDSVNTLLTDIALVKPSKVLTKTNEIYKNAKAAFTDKQLQPERINSSPLNAIKALKERKFVGTTIEEHNKELLDLSDTLGQLYPSLERNYSEQLISSSEYNKAKDDLQALVDGALANKRNFEASNKSTIIQSVVEADPETKDDIQLGSDIDGLISLLSSPDARLTVEEIDTVLKSNVLTPEQREVFESFKTMDTVNDQIFIGGKDVGGKAYKGLNEYLSNIEAAKITRNPELLKERVGELQAWADKFMASRGAFVEAFAKYNDGDPQVLVPNLSGDPEGFFIGPMKKTSANLAAKMEKEIQAFNLGLNQAYVMAGLPNPNKPTEATQTPEKAPVTATPSTPIPPVSKAPVEASAEIIEEAQAIMGTSGDSYQKAYEAASEEVRKVVNAINEGVEVREKSSKPTKATEATTPSTIPPAAQEEASTTSTEATEVTPDAEVATDYVPSAELLKEATAKAAEALTDYLRKSEYTSAGITPLINNWLGNFNSLLKGQDIVDKVWELADTLGKDYVNKIEDRLVKVLEIYARNRYAENTARLNALKGTNITGLSPELKDANKAALESIEANPITISGNTVFAKFTDPITAALSTAGLTEKVTKELVTELKGLAKAIAGPVNYTTMKLIGQNPVLYFSNGSSMLPGIAEAISVAAHTYVSSQGNSLLFNNMDTLKLMFGYDTREDLPRSAFSYSNSGKSLSVVADHIGRDAYDLLGINMVDPIAKKRMIQALGIMGIMGLNNDNKDIKYTKQISVPLKQYLDNFKKDPSDSLSIDEENEGKQKLFVALWSTDDPTTGYKIADGNAAKIINRYREVPEIKEALKARFGVKDRSPRPIIDPDDKRLTLPKYLQNTHQNINDIGKEALTKMNSNPFEFNEVNYNNFMKLYNDKATKDGLLAAFGYEFNLDSIPKYFRDSAKAKNELIIREIEQIIEFKEALDRTKKKAFYIPHTLTKLGRTMLNGSSGLNPRESKLVRFLVNLRNFNGVVNPANPEDMFNFKHAVMSNFKHEVGKLDVEKMSLDFNILSEKVKSISPDDATAIFELAKDSDHPTEAMNAILNLIKYNNSNGKQFAVQIALEVDGKTNGMAWAYPQSGGKLDVATLTAMGIFTQADQQDFATVMKGKPDTYEGVAVVWGSNLTDIEADFQRRNKLKDLAMLNIQKGYLGSFFTRESGQQKVTKAARELSKYPFLKNVFGQSIMAMKEDVGIKLLDAIYKEFWEIKKASIAPINKPEDIQERLTTLNENIKSITGTLGEFSLANMDYLLPTNIENIIKASINITYGKALEDAINEKFSTFMEYRKSVNEAMNIIASIFIQVFNIEKAKKIKKLGRPLTNDEAYGLIYDNKEAPLYKLLPAFLTPNAKSIDEGFIALRAYNKISKEGKVQVTGSRGIVTNYGLDGKPLNNTSSITGGIKELTFEEVGLAVFIGGVHSSDGAQAQRILNEFKALGVHDAFYLSMLDLTNGSQRLNEMFGDMLAEYNIAENVLNRYNEVEKYISEVELKDLGLDFMGTQAIYARITKFKFGDDTQKKPKTPLLTVLQNSITESKAFMKTVKGIHQFPYHYTASLNRSYKGPSSPIQTTPTSTTEDTWYKKNGGLLIVIDKFIDKLIANKVIGSTLRDSYRNYILEMGVSFNTANGSLAIWESKENRSRMIDNTINLAPYVFQEGGRGATTFTHELTHAATAFGVNAAMLEGNKDVVAYGLMLENHKDAIVKYIEEKQAGLNKNENEWKTYDQIRYIYKPAEKDPVDSLRSINESFAVLSNPVFRQAWIEILKDVDPTNSKPAEGLFNKALEAVVKHLRGFFKLLTEQDKRKNTTETVALEMYYKALAKSMELNREAKPKTTSIQADKIFKGFIARDKASAAKAREAEQTTSTTTSNISYKGGFESSGKGTPDGDGKDKAMREIADAFIGEISGIFKGRGEGFQGSFYKQKFNEATSTYTSLMAILDKTKEPGLTTWDTSEGAEAVITGAFVLDNPKVVMLARNKETGRWDISKLTKELIKDAHDKGAVFVVGDMPGVDSQFIDYLQEIGASFTIYHTGPTSRIQVGESATIVDPNVDVKEAELVDSFEADILRYSEIRNKGIQERTKDEDSFMEDTIAKHGRDKIKKALEELNERELRKATEDLKCQGSK